VDSLITKVLGAKAMGCFAAYILVASSVVSVDAPAKPVTRPNTQLFLQDVAEQRNDRESRLAPWKKQWQEQDQLLRRAKAGSINAKLSMNVSLPTPPRSQFSFRTKEAKDDFVKEATSGAAKSKKIFTDFQTNKTPLPPYIKLPLSVGQVGVLEPLNNPSMNVLRIINKEAMVVECLFTDRGSAELKKETILLNEVPTDGIVDSKKLNVASNQVFWVTRTTQDGGATGPKTMMILEPMTEAEWMAFVTDLKN
jgi:hypothetical protein